MYVPTSGASNGFPGAAQGQASYVWSDFLDQTFGVRPGFLHIVHQFEPPYHEVLWDSWRTSGYVVISHHIVAVSILVHGSSAFRSEMHSPPRSMFSHVHRKTQLNDVVCFMLLRQESAAFSHMRLLLTGGSTAAGARARCGPKNTEMQSNRR